MKKLKVEVVNEGTWISFLKVGGRSVEIRIYPGDTPPAETVMAFIVKKLKAEDK